LPNDATKGAKPNLGNTRSQGRKPKLETNHSGHWNLLLNDPWGHLFGRPQDLFAGQDYIDMLDAAYEDKWGRLLIDPDYGKPPLEVLEGGAEAPPAGAESDTGKEAA
jgi:hypothetical protein